MWLSKAKRTRTQHIEENASADSSQEQLHWDTQVGIRSSSHRIHQKESSWNNENGTQQMFL